MRSPFIGRGFAIALIVAFVAWTAVRSIGARPVEPKFPFPKPQQTRRSRPPRVKKKWFSPADVFGVCRPCSST